MDIAGIFGLLLSLGVCTQSPPYTVTNGNTVTVMVCPVEHEAAAPSAPSNIEPDDGDPKKRT